MPDTSSSTTDIFPALTRRDILAFQFSSWYPKFAHVSLKSTIIRPLGDDFWRYLTSDGVFVPEGSEDEPAQSTLSDDDDDSSDEAEDEQTHFTFPDLDAQIRKAIAEYGAVFPKLNFSSPKDASWILPAGSPLKCMSPADVYLLLKSSDFVAHDVTPESVFRGCEPGDTSEPYQLELVLRKWYHFETSREFRCFVRGDTLRGISQRDPNYYEFLNEAETRKNITETIVNLWEHQIRGRGPTSDYTFDVLLTRDLTRGHILDFNPFAPRTDSLLFSYNDLLNLYLGDLSALPTLRVIDSPLHASATRNAPTHQHNMVPLEALSLSEGRNMEDFARIWQDEVQRSIEGD